MKRPARYFARNVYPSSAILWNHSFRNVMEVGADGTLRIDYRKFNEVEPLT